MNNFRVSVIVPVYNREECIVCCIKSILASDFQDFEILLIDDGSTDATPFLCKKLSELDSRVKYYRQDNKGVSAARNYGLSLSSGVWVTFVDSDCAILPAHLNVMQNGKIGSADLIMTGYTSGIYTEGKGLVIKDKINKNDSEVVFAQSAARFLLNDFQPFKHSFYLVWNKFFKRKIIKEHNLQFDESMSLGEDQVFLCNYLRYANGLYYFKCKTYIDVQWSHLDHLGSKLRTPENFLYNQKKNYDALCRLQSLAGEGGKAYAIDYGIDRPITRVLLNYTKFKNRNLLAKGELKRFTQSEIIPFLSTIDISKYNARNFHVRIIRALLLRVNVDVAFVYCIFYNSISILKKMLSKIILCDKMKF